MAMDTLSFSETQEQVDRKTRRIMKAYNITDYEKAMHIVLDKNPSLRAAYSGVEIEDAQEANFSESNKLRLEVHERIEEYCLEHGLDLTADYDKAMAAVFSEDPALKARYAAS